MNSSVTIEFVNGGYILHTSSDGNSAKTEVFTSVGKLNRAVRTAIDEFSLLPKKAEETEE